MGNKVLDKTIDFSNIFSSLADDHGDRFVFKYHYKLDFLIPMPNKTSSIVPSGDISMPLPFLLPFFQFPL